MLKIHLMLLMSAGLCAQGLAQATKPAADKDAKAPVAKTVELKTIERKADDAKAADAPEAPKAAEGRAVDARAKIAVAPPAAVQRQDPVASRLKSMETQLNSAKQAKSAGRFDRKALLDLPIVEGMIQPVWKGNLPQSQQHRLDLPDSKVFWTVQVQPYPGHPTPNVTLSRFDPDALNGDGFWLVTLRFGGPRQFSLTAQGGIKSPIMSTTYSQSVNMVQLNVNQQENGRAKGALVRLNAPNLLELDQNNAEAVREYLSPLLREIMGEDLLRPGSADIYRVFSDIPADPSVAAMVDELLIEADAEAFGRREAASVKLANLGAPGVLAMLRLDPEELTAEQSSRIALILADHTRRSNLPADELSEDVHFLVDCLTDGDPRVREAAVKQIEQLTGQPLKVLLDQPEFKLDQPDDQLFKETQKLREKLRKFTENREKPAE